MTATLLMLLGLAQATPPAQVSEQPGRQLRGLAVSLDVYGIHRFDDGYQLFEGGHDHTAGGVEASYDLVRVGELARLALGLGLLIENRETGGDLQGGTPLALESTALNASASLRFRPTRALQPYVAVAAGVNWATLAVGSQSTTSLESKATSLLGRAALGARLQPAALLWRSASGTPILNFALAGELGATAGTPLEFSLTAAVTGVAAGDEPIPVSSVPLGKLAQTGAYGRLMLTAVF